MKTSEKNLISIRKFVSNFLLHSYGENKKLTHNYLNFYLNEKGISIPKRVKFSQIKPIDILFSNVILVKDENGKVIAYENPLLLNEVRLLNDLNSANKDDIEKVRVKNIEEQGYYVSTFGDVVDPNEEIEPIIQHENRYRKLVNKRVRRKLC